MRRLVPLSVLAALLALARPAATAEEIWLRWNGCDNGGLASIVHNCSQFTAHRNLYVSASPAQDVTQVVGAIFVLDLVTSTADLPDWWKMAPGECRADAFTGNDEMSALISCSDLWGGNAAVLVQGYGSRAGGSPNQARFIATAGVLPSGAVTMPAGSPSALAHLQIDVSDAPSTPCTGCGLGACFVLNSVELVRLPGAPGGNVVLVQPGQGDGNFAIWQAGAPCVSVPARNRTWGQIKALYR